jgi:hypothetical protein
MRILILLLFMLLSFWLMGCTHTQQRTDQPEVDVGKEEASIRATDAQWLAAAKARDTEQAASFWSDDATILMPNSPPIMGSKPYEHTLLSLSSRQISRLSGQPTRS